MKTPLGRVITAFALIVALVPAMQTLVHAQIGPTVHGMQIAVTNHADMCAWITIYRANGATAWGIENGAHSRPRFVSPGDTYTFKTVMSTALGIPTELKVRAQMERKGNCSQGTREAANLEREFKGLQPQNPAYAMQFSATIRGANGHYSMDLHKTGNIR